MKAFAGPRRLTLAVDGLAPAQSDRQEERKGPRANAPDQAIEGFLRSTGLARPRAGKSRSGAVVTLNNISTLRTLFNRDSGHPRLILIFSPT